jgi:2-C-methyl-D-erythritol 4-phosphate cytidylyltransferase
MYAWSLRTLNADERLNPIVVVVPSAMSESIGSQIDSLIAPRSRAKEILIIGGGTTRQGSVYAGLQRLKAESERSTHVIVHDAARPLLNAQLLERFLSALYEKDACALALPLSDTIKRTKDDIIIETLPRQDLCAMQTPQGARFDLMLEAHELAKEEGIDATDDVALLERTKVRTTIVQGSSTNIKVTNQDDMFIAESLLAHKIATNKNQC